MSFFPTTNIKRTRNCLTIKRIEDDPDVQDGLQLIGVFTQDVYDLSEEEFTEHVDNNEEEGYSFDYRINDYRVNDSLLVQKRKTRPLRLKQDDNGKDTTILGCRTIFEARIPLIMETAFIAFPFNVTTARAEIDLCSKLGKGCNWIRPDLMLHMQDHRHNICIPPIKPTLESTLPDDDDDIIIHNTHGGGFISSILNLFVSDYHLKEETDRTLRQIDESVNFDFITPYPRVHYQYNNTKKSCTKFVVSFYTIKATAGFVKFVSIILPMVLISCINTLNVWHEWKTVTGENSVLDVCERGVDPVNYLQVTSALALTAVFILPQIIDPTTRNYSNGHDSLYVIIIFVSLVLSSFPANIVCTTAIEIAGAVLMWFSFLIPAVNFYHYSKITTAMKKQMKHMAFKKMFLLDHTKFQHWNPDTGLTGHFCTTNEIMNNATTDVSKMYVINRESTKIEMEGSRKDTHIYYNTKKQPIQTTSTKPIVESIKTIQTINTMKSAKSIQTTNPIHNTKKPSQTGTEQESWT